MTSLLAVIGSVTPPGRLRAAIAGAVEVAAAQPGVSASLALLAMGDSARGPLGPPPLAARPR